ncbi:MAG: hypothetical protein EPN84_12715 [Legionella sp.]|nr:MAG: hypothetical protein EPN84_12715 [Legionella sp.]
MNEMDVLDVFYDELRAEGTTRENLFISLDESVVAKLTHKLKQEVTLEQLHKLADICIANEWLERTTADPAYKYLSLTAAGLQMAVEYQYKVRNKT